MAAMAEMDARLAERPFIAGKRLSIADITALCAIGYGGFVDITIPAELGNLQLWYDAISSRPSASA